MNPTLHAAEAPHQPHRILPVFAGEAPDLSPLPEPQRGPALATARLRGFKGARGESLLLPFGAEQWLVAGLGDPAGLSRPAWCEAIALGYSELKKAGGREMALLLPAGLPWPAGQAARYAAEALLMAGYAFRPYRTREDRAEETEVTLTRAGEREAVAEGIRQGSLVGAGILLTRDLINHPAAVAHTEFLAGQARLVAEALGAGYHCLQGEALAREGYTALAAVGQAAEHPAALVTLQYGRAGPQLPTVALVGKGVTFDTGGLDLKPSASMALMKKDMGGAATVLGAFQAIAALELPVHLVAVLGLAENAVDARSYRPGDILRSKAGLTIEISNTDAEGRVVLADALAHARTHRPHFLVDFATLTSACRIALGKELMGLFCDHAPLRAALVDSAEACGDHLWPLPLWSPYRKQLDSAVADLVNAVPGGLAGAILAALFLREFAGEVAWAHLDCYAWSEGESPLFPKGGSGVGVRLCVELMHRLTEIHAHGG